MQPDFSRRSRPDPLDTHPPGSRLRLEEILDDLRRQARDRERAGYDGHNRHSGIVTMRRLKIRRLRRWWNRVTMQWVVRGPRSPD